MTSRAHLRWIASRLLAWLEHAHPDGLTPDDLYARSGAVNADGSFEEGFSETDVDRGLRSLAARGLARRDGWDGMDPVWVATMEGEDECNEPRRNEG